MTLHEFTLSPLEEQQFGVRTTRVNEITSEAMPALLDYCRENQVRLVIARCSTEDLTTAQDLEEAGARVMDTLIYYTYEYARRPDAEFNSRTTIRAVRPDEVEEVCTIATRSFEGYRGHYHVDRKLDQEACDRVYPSWVRRSVLDRAVAGEVFVCEVDERMAGFATMRQNSPEEGEGVLFGVATWAQGRGIYRDLIQRGLAWCRASGSQRMVVSTQVTNLAVQKVWVRSGFEPSRSYYTFHLWLP
jgi:GNAT superfamily N-acetyltransferase